MNFFSLAMLTLPTLVFGYENRFSSDAYSTHQPVLHKIASETTGPIIEFGCGHGSTDLLHEICRKEGRLLVTLDDNFDWLIRFASRYKNDGYKTDNSGWHKFYFVPGKEGDTNPDHWIKFLDEFELLKTTVFEVCFIDQSPWLGRWEALKRMKDIARYVLVHDCDFFPGSQIFGKTIVPIQNRQPGVFDFSDVFRSFKVYFPKAPWPGDTGPPTLVGSNFESDLPEVSFD